MSIYLISKIPYLLYWLKYCDQTFQSNTFHFLRAIASAVANVANRNGQIDSWGFFSWQKTFKLNRYWLKSSTILNSQSTWVHVPVDSKGKASKNSPYEIQYFAEAAQFLYSFILQVTETRFFTFNSFKERLYS